MVQYKEMVIRRPQVCRMPSLSLNGKWLEDLQFTVGVTVSVVYRDSCLTITTCPNVKNSIAVLVVESKQVRGRSRPQIILNGFILKKYGLNVGDRVGLHLMPDQIQIVKINRFTNAEVV